MARGTCGSAFDDFLINRSRPSIPDPHSLEIPTALGKGHVLPDHVAKITMMERRGPNLLINPTEQDTYEVPYILVSLNQRINGEKIFNVSAKGLPEGLVTDGQTLRWLLLDFSVDREGQTSFGSHGRKLLWILKQADAQVKVVHSDPKVLDALKDYLTKHDSLPKETEFKLDTENVFPVGRSASRSVFFPEGDGIQSVKGHMTVPTPPFSNEKGWTAAESRLAIKDSKDIVAVFDSKEKTPSGERRFYYFPDATEITIELKNVKIPGETEPGYTSAITFRQYGKDQAFDAKTHLIVPGMAIGNDKLMSQAAEVNGYTGMRGVAEFLKVAYAGPAGEGAAHLWYQKRGAINHSYHTQNQGFILKSDLSLPGGKGNRSGAAFGRDWNLSTDHVVIPNGLFKGTRSEPSIEWTHLADYERLELIHHYYESFETYLVEMIVADKRLGPGETAEDLKKTLKTTRIAEIDKQIEAWKDPKSRHDLLPDMKVDYGCLIDGRWKGGVPPPPPKK